MSDVARYILDALARQREENQRREAREQAVRRALERRMEQRRALESLPRVAYRGIRQDGTD